LWDLRRALAWLRSQEDAARIGVLGYSLGGYNAALLAQFERELDFVIAGIPPSDFGAALWRHVPPAHRDYFAAHGIDLERYRSLLRPISPLARPPLVAADRRYIFAGVADRVVLPDQAIALGKHWQTPIQWYQGAHLTFRGERVVRFHIEAAMQRAGWPVSVDLGSMPQEEHA
jgi:acetyl esterase/lipase